MPRVAVTGVTCGRRIAAIVAALAIVAAVGCTPSARPVPAPGAPEFTEIEAPSLDDRPELTEILR
jgi:hypothetical protein